MSSAGTITGQYFINLTFYFYNIYVICSCMKWKITYYNDAVRDNILKLPKSLLARYLRTINLVEIFGANLGEPHTKAFGNGLFELRLKGREGIARVFYCTVIGKEVIMLHSFIKKTQKTPKKELDIAQSRLKEIKDEKK